MSYSEAWSPSLRLPRQNGKTDPLVRRVIELEDENKKLRDEFRKMDEWHSKELTAAMAENAKLRELCEKLYGYYVSGTLVPCDFCDRYDCEGNAPTTCKADEYEPDGIVAKEIERLMRKLGVEV